MDQLERLRRDTAAGRTSCGSLPFWSWNDRLEEKELRRQIQRMAQLGMNGFFMHARGGLETAYLSEDWFAAVNTCIDEAEKNGLQAWSYDENGWPSGFAGGKLLEEPENLARYLTLEECTDWPEREDVLGVYRMENGRIEQLEAPVCGPCYAIRVHTDSALCDSLDKTVTEKFLRETHAVYEKKIPSSAFGKSMPGFFTDEPQYYRWGTVWSDTLPAEFEKAYGYSVFSGLPALFLDFEGAREFRFDYWKLCHRLFIDHWLRPVYDWCDSHGCQLTGHAVEENSLAGQMWCCGGIMHFYEYEHIPGMDYLTRNMFNDVASKQLGSVRAQTGKKQALSEMFGCCGWDVTPRELRRIAQRQFVNGVNIMCSHLYAYSLRGQRKRDYPAVYSEQLPWQRYLKEFNDYFTNLGYLLSLGQEWAQVLVIHPIHSAYLDYRRADDNSIRPLEEAFQKLSDELSENHVFYHWGDENMLAELGRVEGSQISLGACTYDTVVIPSMENLDRATADLLRTFLENGGKVFCYGTIPDRIDGRKADCSFLHSTVSFRELCRDCAMELRTGAGENGRELRVMERRIEYGRLWYVVNLAEHDENGVALTLPHTAGVTELDPQSMEPLPLHAERTGENVTVTADFPMGGAHLYLESGEIQQAPAEEKRYISLDRPFTLEKTPENALTLDRFALSLDGGETWTEERPIERIRDELLQQRYRGDIALKARFQAETVPEELLLVAEPIKGMTLSVNGNLLEVPCGWRIDRCFPAFEIRQLVKPGENEIQLRLPYYQSEHVYHVLYDGVSESLRNCLNFDTEIECLYLFGSFRLASPQVFRPEEKQTWIQDSGAFTLIPPARSIDPRNVVTEGYPFFAGTLELGFDLPYAPGNPTWLRLGGRWAVCEIFVNGQKADTLLFSTETDLRPWLREGENRVTLHLTNSNRNLLGPHHFPDPEPLAVHPLVFSTENGWKDGNCENYVNRYAFMRFGIE